MIYTFYSYKGGVGRSMALANVAELLYQSGLKVLVIDWDLEAPGMERYFFSEPDIEKVLEKPGVIDMLQGYKNQMSQELQISEDENTLPFETPDQFFVDIHSNPSEEGRLWLIPAGRRSKDHFAEYAYKVRTFDWQGFYDNWEGELYFDWLHQQFEQAADVVLIDSRTGVTEMGGVCTYQFADVIVMFCAANQQNLEGTYRMLLDFKDPRVEKLRNRPLDVLVVPARIENGESDFLNEFQERFGTIFTPYTPSILGTGLDLFRRLAIPYTPRYAYKEIIAVREKTKASAKEMVDAFSLLTFTISRLAPEDAAVRLALPETEITIGGETVIGSIVGGDLVVGEKAVSTSVQIREVFGDIASSIIAGRDVIQNIIYPFADDRFYISRAITEYGIGLYQRILASLISTVTVPYKFLNAFDLEDEKIFFGRDRMLKKLHRTLMSDRLVVLDAESGVGKTSLLNAGILPLLIREDRLPVYINVYDDPIIAIKRVIAPYSLGPWPQSLPQLALEEFLSFASESLGHQIKELVIIFDQFEEFFVLDPESEKRQQFFESLIACYNNEALPIRFIISIQSDYVSHLIPLLIDLPNIHRNLYQLEAMSRDELQMAITGAVTKCGITYEQALLHVLLDDLGDNGMELSHLQIVCTRLYESLLEGETTIRLKKYEQLGRKEGILKSYVHDALGRFSERDELIAKDILEELITSPATEQLLTNEVLSKRITFSKQETVNILDWLVEARLLRKKASTGETSYEIAHDYLTPAINSWIDQVDLEFEQIEELLRLEVETWRMHGTPIPRGRLGLLYRYRDRLLELDTETQECVLSSALHYRFAVQEWVKLTGKTGKDVLLAALQSPEITLRQTAAETLGSFRDSSVEEPLINSLRDESSDVRSAAAKALGELGDTRAIESLIAALSDESSDVRSAAAKALGELGDTRAVESLIAALSDDNRDARSSAVKAIGQIGMPVMDPLIAVLQDDDWYIRQGAAQALGQIGDTRAVELLITALQDQDREVRQGAAQALGQIGDTRAVELLITALQDQDREVRQGAAQALGQIGDTRAVELLITALQDQDREVRQASAQTLGHIGDIQAVEPLIFALEDRSQEVRRLAAVALKEIGTPEALSAIENLSIHS
jgi:HEAT repeat protein/cellulose biosynthesis protein BcsQ